jgi:hypothetical protein
MITPTWPGSTPASAVTERSAASTPSSGACGVVKIFPVNPPLADFQRHVGERAADIDAEPDCRGGCHA